MSATIEKIFIAAVGGAGMQSLEEVEALAGAGLEGDRYCRGSGYWSKVDACEVTLIESEDLEQIVAATRVSVLNGEHRRNLVTRGLRLESLAGRRFRVGDAILEFDRLRPPCRYIESLTERNMTKALLEGGGICARVLHPGKIRVHDPIVIL
ncbi:MAG: MOSC domain-containing protein [Acidobacteria bacterium]|nr:MOSC domain-containing protein [Acidobacteriota bacterium]